MISRLKRSFVAVAVFAAACGSKSKQPETMPEPTPSPEPVAEAPAPEPEQAPAPEPEPAPPPPPKKLTTEEMVKAHDACFANYTSGKNEQMVADCVTDSTTSETVDSGMPPETGKQDAVKGAKDFWAAFPDLAAEQTLTLANGNNIALVANFHGTNTGSMMGMPATNKKFGMLGVEVLESTDDGKHGPTRIYYDAATMMGQLGLSPKGAKFRKANDAMTAERELVIATDSDAEKANVDKVKSCIDLFSAGDLKTLGKDCVTKDWVYSNQSFPADLKGAKASAHLKAFRKAFPDAKETVTTAWAAGDYVFVEAELTGTNKGALPAMGIKKATGKSVTLHIAQIFKIKDGKATQVWEFENGMALAMQLGLVQPPAEKPAEK